MRILPILVLIALRSLAFASDKPQYGTLVVGDEMVMDVTLTFSGKSLNGSARRKIEASEQHNEKAYFRVVSILEIGPTPQTVIKLMRRDDTGVYSIDPTKTNAAEELELSLPLEIEKHWTKTFQGRATTHTVLAIETLNTNGKAYSDCAHVRSVGTDGSTEDYWEAPGVGAIRSVIVYPNGMRMELNLREFKSGRAK